MGDSNMSGMNVSSEAVSTAMKDIKADGGVSDETKAALSKEYGADMASEIIAKANELSCYTDPNASGPYGDPNANAIDLIYPGAAGTELPATFR